ncbi:hypothetical protein [Paeniroseomonas aquatica]|uniref:hypothetical protein n=1 Tax=Paeniroseomonas aquatica TaxID=373043 RepID=UPI0025B2A9FE|nr:hypothetical protein [Paeniroseomonas aquatica]
MMLLLCMLTGTNAMAAPDSPMDWPPLTSRFESTGGGGWMIEGYDPVIAGMRCVTDFAAVAPDGQVFRNEVEFDAVAVTGGVLCENGRWRAKDGSSSGTTPLRVLIRDDGRRFRSP